MHDDPSGADGDERDDDADGPQKRSDAVTRRRLVASGAAAWATVSVAGCRYITDPGVDTATETASPTPTPTVTTETTTTDTPVGPTPTPDPDATPTETPTPSPTPTPTPPATTTACASIGEFAPGQEVGLHVGVYDGRTGDPLGSGDLESVTVAFPDAHYDRRELNWRGPHERYDEQTWGTKIVTATDAEPGTYRYEVAVEGEDGEVEATVTNRFTILG
ncbi:MAG: hypothetical protein V5A44_08890 [Haloarculaceae archaeon]